MAGSMFIASQVIWNGAEYTHLDCNSNADCCYFQAASSTPCVHKNGVSYDFNLLLVLDAAIMICRFWIEVLLGIVLTYPKGVVLRNV